MEFGITINIRTPLNHAVELTPFPAAGIASGTNSVYLSTRSPTSNPALLADYQLLTPNGVAVTNGGWNFGQKNPGVFFLRASQSNNPTMGVYHEIRIGF